MPAPTKRVTTHDLLAWKREGRKIVALTAYAMKGDEERALAAGCDGYLPKPIDTRTFPGAVARFLAGDAA